MGLRSTRAPGLSRALLGAFSIACLLFAVQGCGSSSSDSSSDSTSSSGSLVEPNKGGPISDQDVKVASEFFGGTAGKATKSPIKVGLVTIGGGPIEEGTGNNVVYAGQELINEDLGGVDGHPIEFVKCPTGASDEQAQACGQKFANDPDIKLVLNPAQPSGGAALLGAMNGAKAEICAFPIQPEFLGVNVFCPDGGALALSASVSYITEHTDAKTVAQLIPDADIFRQTSAIASNQMEEAGLKVTEGYVPLNSPDVISAVVASKAQSADAIYITLTSPGQCIAVAEALESLGVSESTLVISAPSCIEPPVVDALGDAPKWTYFDLGESANLPEPTPEAQVYLDALETYGGGGPQGVWSTIKFGTTLWMGRLLREAWPDLSTENIVAKAKAFKGPMFLGDPKIAFDQPPFRNLGTLSGRFFNYEGDGKWSDATNGEYILPPAE